VKTYPIRARLSGYHGSDPRKRRKADEHNRVARRVEDYINKRIESEPEDTIHQFMSQNIAYDLGEDVKLVGEIVFAIDCGHNGVTIVKGSFDRAIAAASRPGK
jgi:hypothetical protein